MKNLIQQIKLLETINQKNVKDRKFLLKKEKNIEIYYAPFDYINSKAKIVEDCTDTKVIPKPPWFERKKQYISDLKKKPQSSLLVSICDKTHNASCIINDYHRVGKKLWTRFNADPKKIYWYYESLGNCYYKNLKGHKVLKQNFKKLVSVMKSISK